MCLPWNCICLQHIIWVCPPKIIWSELQFIAKEFLQVWTNNGIVDRSSVAYKPLKKPILLTLLTTNTRYLLVYRNTPHSPAGESPSKWFSRAGDCAFTWTYAGLGMPTQHHAQSHRTQRPSLVFYQWFCWLLDHLLRDPWDALRRWLLQRKAERLNISLCHLMSPLIWIILATLFLIQLFRLCLFLLLLSWISPFDWLENQIPTVSKPLTGASLITKLLARDFWLCQCQDNCISSYQAPSCDNPASIENVILGENLVGSQRDFNDYKFNSWQKLYYSF